MHAMNEWNSPIFAESFLAWTGYGRANMPRRDDASVVSGFGAEAADELLASIKSLMDAYYSSDAKYTATDLIEMGRLATEQFSAKHPDVPDKVLQALAWCPTFDFR